MATDFSWRYANCSKHINPYIRLIDCTSAAALASEQHPEKEVIVEQLKPTKKKLFVYRAGVPYPVEGA